MSKPRRVTAVFVSCLFLAASFGRTSHATPVKPWANMENIFVYIGTYTQTSSKGIYVMHMNPETGALTQPELAGQTASPSFLAIHPNHRFLYSVNEVTNFEGKKSGAVSAFAIEPKTGKLTLLNHQPSGGEGPCYVGLDHTGKVAFVANYNSGSVASFPIAGDGKLGEAATIDQHKGKGANPQRQEGPHAHCFDVDPGNHFALSNDLGLDKIFVYRFDPRTAKLTPNTPPTASLAGGSGPRHLAFSPDGRFVYCINEIASTLTTFHYNAEEGSLKEVQTVSTLPKDFKGNSTTAEVIVHPSGKFLYGSNRGADSIAIFKIDQATGELTPAGHESTQGKTPRGFNVDPSGSFLIAANQGSDSIYSFKIDQDSGALKPTGAMVKVGMPVHVLFMVENQP